MLAQPPPLPSSEAVPESVAESASRPYVEPEAEVIDGSTWSAAGLDALDAVKVEAELLKQVAHATARLHLALGRLAAVRVGIEGIEAAMTALAAGSDCPVCGSSELRAALSRFRALTEEQ